MHQFNKISRRLALCLAFLVGFSSLGLGFDMHYCNGDLKNVSFVGKAKSCHEIRALMKANNCSSLIKACHKEAFVDCGENDHKDCCSNKMVKLENDFEKINQVQQSVNSELSLNFVFAFVKSYFVSSSEHKSIQSFDYYFPPDLNINPIISFQNFRC